MRAAATNIDRVQLKDVPLVFLGYGVTAPERKWDDYQGVDMHGKVGIVLVNAARPTRPQQVDTPTSYLAVNELLSRFLTDDPFAKSSLDLATYTQNLPRTDFVAENDGTVMMQIGQRYMMRTPDGEWSAWD